MILVDVNLLIYATQPESPHHQRARRWLGQRLAGPARVGLPWATVLGFLRLVTMPRSWNRAVTVDDAVAVVERWLAAPAVWVPTPTERHAEILAGLLRAVGRGGKLVPDAHLAALAIEHGLILCSTDGDFARFPGLRWENPLQRL